MLPEPYRTFMAEVANGTRAERPDARGLLPLGEIPATWTGWESENWMSPEPFNASAPRDPSMPFPLNEEWQWEYDYDGQAGHSSLLHALYLHGSVLLGCEDGEFWVLVVTGPQRGRVWWLGDGCATPYADGTTDWEARSAFASWMREWHDWAGHQ
ncbi:SMI1/KNR4 family protein [Streptomyces sp. NBC_00620]|uniref:SMI1/KNR4 family protein n=1 Tax=Streptomyces sp. NBC_00620 TaxID=2903666 RepID=UPI00225214B7|nr:SMI1/KNR4 family protein [Streptomyces sp. NBC_00620]MCX4974516.1 SMI1/KNR4 family protein [Streptomyces sp. NBC_00620]